ncbi:MotA/TolQ/ExbB proton channel family protein [Ruegeria sp. EL01]|jgi:biopolymer transport protein ExbB|uniref:MotA/TolQ/ExbB proton channel family protein n=1 Tax=Ruegeria sp. EL01 TaxID=2107578 RepID=UPI000EA82F9C|nr:MotA/TolQ/ExbB proton channel family protein [Ruegeria sp. EL01]
MNKNSIILAVFLAIPIDGFAQNTTPPATPELLALPQPTLGANAVTQAAPPSNIADPAPVKSHTTRHVATAGTEGAEPALPRSNADPAATQETDLWQSTRSASGKATEFLKNGGPSIWAIAALSVITLSLILWKIWRLALIGAWSRGKAGQAVTKFESGDLDGALSTVKGRAGIRSKVVAHAIRSIRQMPEERAREETTRVAKREIAQAGTGLRALELIATIAPLLGLLGTVLGMIAAFQALQQAGNRADPALLAGGIWEALLTTAAGMAVAIPASAALTWFEAVIDRIRRDVEDGATRLFVAQKPEEIRLAAE